MAGGPALRMGGTLAPGRSRATREPAVVRALLIALTVLFLGVLLALPLTVVLIEALRKVLAVWAAALRASDALAAIRRALATAALVVPLTSLFALAAACALATFRFRGESLLTSLIDLPFSVSPVIAGLVYVLLFGRQGWFGPWLLEHDVRII